MIRRLCLLIVAGTVILSTTAATAADPQVVKKVFGGEKAYAIMDMAKKVTAHRLTQAKRGNATYTEGDAVAVTDELLVRLRKTLRDPMTYLFDVAKGCEPIYGVRLKFVSGASTLQIDLCYECEILTVLLDGKGVGEEDFDGGAAELQAIAKKLFPEDKEIQALGK